MSRVQFARQMLPRICKDFYELEIYHNPLGSLTFDPIITTSISTTVIWQPDDAPATVTTGTNHAFSYVPGAGYHRCKVTVVGGLRFVTAIDCNTDVIAEIKNIKKLTNCSNWIAHTNPEMRMDLGNISKLVTNLVFNSDAAISGNMNFPNAITLKFPGCPGISGAISNIGAATQSAWLYGDVLLVADSLVNAVGIRDIRIYDMLWDQSEVDAVLMSASEAILANDAHFTYATPVMNIGGTNAAPSGIYQAPSGDGGHAVSGLEAVYALTHNVGHAWTITIAGPVTYP